VRYGNCCTIGDIHCYTPADDEDISGPPWATQEIIERERRERLECNIAVALTPAYDAYIDGEIEVDDLERRVERALRVWLM
jgi:hypothetical protein